MTDFGLILLGEGALNDHYKKMARDLGIGDRVLFLGRIRQDELLHYTAEADVGLALIENICENNFYALPNKLFEYIIGRSSGIGD